jgi:hypothetical protein
MGLEILIPRFSTLPSPVRDSAGLMKTSRTLASVDGDGLPCPAKRTGASRRQPAPVEHAGIGYDGRNRGVACTFLHGFGFRSGLPSSVRLSQIPGRWMGGNLLFALFGISDHGLPARQQAAVELLPELFHRPGSPHLAAVLEPFLQWKGRFEEQSAKQCAAP